MATDTAPTKEEFVVALRNKGINSLADLVNAIWPEPGAYRVENSELMLLVRIPDKGLFGVKWHQDDAEG